MKKVSFLIVMLAFSSFLFFVNAYAQTCPIQWDDASVIDLYDINSRAGAAVLNEKIYYIGGHRGYGGYLNEAEVYDPQTNRWSYIHSLYTNRTYPATVAYGGKIWAINGKSSGYGVEDSIEIYDPATNDWITSDKPLGIRTADSRVVALDNKIFLSGGDNYENGILNIMYMWDGTDWKAQKPMPITSSGHSMTVYNGEIYVIGGITNSGYHPNTLIYNPDLNEWRNGPSLNYPRSCHVSVTIGSRIFVFGGIMFKNGSYQNTKSVEVLDLAASTPTWQISDCEGSTIIGQWATAVVYNGAIYAFGGLVDNQPTKTAVKGIVGLPPVANAGENLSIRSEEQSTTIILGTASDPNGDTLSYQWLEGENELTSWAYVGPNGEAHLYLSQLGGLSVREHKLTLKVFDGQNSSTDDMNLTVGNSAPHAAPTGSGVYPLNTQVILGGQVSDFDGDLLTYEWLEGTSVLYTGTIQSVYGGTPVSLTNLPMINFSLGVHNLALRLSDGINTVTSAPLRIEIIDTQAPILSPTTSTTILWPPNHKMVNVTILANASDNSGGAVYLSAVVSSNEPQDGLGDGDAYPDWTTPVVNQATGAISLQLRAERSGSGNGRVYTVVITGTDQSGNSSSANVKIIVPHDKNK
jgi:N-acetylneuraminic acid mutarotase